MSLLQLVTVSFFAGALAFNCSIPPIYVDVHKRAVHGSNTFQYGSFVGVGTPAQNQSLWFTLSDNETSVADGDFCQQSNLTDCNNTSGGFFATNLSTTWQQLDNYNSSDDDPQNKDPATYGQDRVHLYQHFFETDGATETVVNNLPVLLAANGSSQPDKLGLGLGSTVLDQLYVGNLTASRAFSLYTGTGFDRAGGAINGSLTLGGYDASRFIGPVYNYTLNASDSNPFHVRVSDIVIHNSGSNAPNLSLFDTAHFTNLDSNFSGFDADISADQFPLSLPYQVTQNFMSVLSAVPSNSPDGSLELSKPFNGSMSISLSNGFTVTLPSEMLFNSSGLSPVAAQTQHSTSGFLLTTAWLTQVYLMADYDAQAFHLAQAVPEAPYISVRTTCPGVVPMAYTNPTGTSFTRAGLVGGVVGGVIGGIFLCTLATLGFLAWSRRRRTTPKQAEEMVMDPKVAQFELEDGTLVKVPLKRFASSRLGRHL